MIRLHHVLLAGALLALSAAPSQAAFQGSLGVNGDNVTQSPGNLASSTLFTTTGNTVLSQGDGGFNGAMGAVFSGTTIDLNDPAGYGFTMTNGEWGTFTADAVGQVFNNRPNTLTVAVTGIYTGGTNAATSGVVTSTFSALITFTQIGNSITQQIVLEVPVIPEPSSVALGAIGLVSMSLVALRKRRSK